MRKRDGNNNLTQQLPDFSKVVLRKPFKLVVLKFGLRNRTLDHWFTDGAHHKLVTNKQVCMRVAHSNK